MRFDLIQKSITEVECDVIVVNMFEETKELTGATGAVDSAVGGALKALIDREGFEGKVGQTTDLTPCGGVPAGRIILVGLGKKDELDADKVRNASAAAARRAKDLSAKKVATVLHGAGAGGLDPAAAAQAVVEGAILSTYQFLKHKTKDVKLSSIEEIDIIETDESKTGAIKTGMQRGKITAEATSLARDLVNEPANIVTPSYLAEQAKLVADETGLDCRVIEREEMKKMGMNLLLAVSKGSREEPKFIILKYTSPGATKTVAIAGKGITFDSGGLNLKPSAGLDSLKDDMAGAAAVLATMKAIGALKPKVNVLALMPATENLPGGNATKPGDVVVGLSGRSVEINNTDAEGRLILSDAVAYAEREGVDEIIDMATLTGACIVALGKRIAGIFGSDQGMIDKLIAAANAGGEKLWQLPLLPDYDELLNSDFADMKNTPNEAGAITGALFIKRHIEKTPWVHIDIAGPSFGDRDSGTSTKGASGFGVYTLVNYLMAQ
jgi:leucyl aminopeptidase